MTTAVLSESPIRGSLDGNRKQSYSFDSSRGGTGDSRKSRQKHPKGKGR